MGVILFTLLCGSKSIHIFVVVHHSRKADTPWDRPDEDHSPEYARYLTHEILSEAPWDRIPEDVLCLSLLFVKC